MAGESYSILGQASPAAATPDPIYTVPADTQAVISTIVACNRSATDSAIRVSVAIAGAAEADAQWLEYDFNLRGNSAIPFTYGITLAETDVVRVETENATVSFNVFGSEITA